MARVVEAGNFCEDRVDGGVDIGRQRIPRLLLGSGLECSFQARKRAFDVCWAAFGILVGQRHGEGFRELELLAEAFQLLKERGCGGVRLLRLVRGDA
ncbi:MAG: hypothetical protein AAFZ02_11915 [Pseudomonadota bacterium]